MHVVFFTSNWLSSVSVDDETEPRTQASTRPHKDPTDLDLSNGGRNDDVSNRPHKDEAPAPRRVAVAGFEPAHQRVPGRLGNRAPGRTSGTVQGFVSDDSQAPFRIVGYEHLRNSLKTDGGSLSLPAKALSGVIAQLVASPADLVKVRMQADGRFVSQGFQPRYSGCFDALNKIARAEGVGGLWKGVFPNVQRAFLVNMGELACYDHAKRFVINNQISEDNICAHTLASIMLGLSATALSCPADVVKTRMMNQSKIKEGKIMYSSSYDCLVKIVKVEGLRALWKGFFPTWARLGPWQFVFWVSYERFRQIAGFSSFWLRYRLSLIVCRGT